MLYSHEKLSFDRYVVFPARFKAYGGFDGETLLQVRFSIFSIVSGRSSGRRLPWQREETRSEE